MTEEQQMTLPLETAEVPKALVKINFVPHTLYVLCGPTMCGKSTFAELLQAQILASGYDAAIVSSDELRSRFSVLHAIGGEGSNDRHSPSMTARSEAAFAMLTAELKALTSFPVNTPAVIVDTTGMNEAFRQHMADLGKAQGYRTVLVVFDYKSRSDYVRPGFTDQQIRIIADSRDHFRRKVLSALKAKMFDERIRVVKPFSSLDPQQIELVFGGEYDLGELTLSTDEPRAVAVIGDSHENVGALKQLITKIDSKYPGITFVHVGDYLDKGGNTREMIDFMYSRVFRCGDLVIRGNHERYVQGRLRGEVKEAAPVEATEFGSYAVLKDDEQLAQKFLDIWDLSLPFLVIKGVSAGSTPVYVTHAPCESRHLGKIHSASLSAQRNYRTKDRERSIYEELKWLYQDAASNMPLHIFGHTTHVLDESAATDFLATRRQMLWKNRLFLDTGAVYGGRLSAAIVQDGRLVDIVSVKAPLLREAPQPVALGRGPSKLDSKFRIEDYDLDLTSMRLVRQIKANNIQYISGTMSPGPSTESEIEPLRAAIDYYKKSGATHLMMQPKWMGSRAQLYLFKDRPEDTFMVSRGGWKIRGVSGKTAEEYQQFLLACYEKHRLLLEMFQANAILDGELMPWHALGEGLISHEFTPYQQLVAREIEELQNDGYLMQVCPEFAQSLNLATKAEHIARFGEVLSRYSAPAEPEYKAFSILKIYNPDPNWTITVGKMNEQTKFRMVAEVKDYDLCLSLDLTAEGEALEAQLAKAAKLFETLTVEKGMEGVVLKQLEGESNIPFLKVRSPEYLRLVYGYDWMDRKDRLCWQKNISGKVRLSVHEAKLAHKMLTVPAEEREEFVVKMVGAVLQEKSLDPRL